jgi:hypothetical protein
MRKPPASRITASSEAASAAPFLQQAQRLGVVRARHAVDDEAGRRLRVHRVLAPGFGGGVDGVGDGLVGGDAADHFDQRHQRHRIEEVHADQRSGRCRPAAMAVTEIDEVLVARMQSGPTMPSSSANRVRLTSRSSTTASTASAHPRFASVAHRQQALAREVGLGRAHAALLDQLGEGLADGGDGLVDGARALVEQAHRVAGHGRDLGDAAAHGAAADHGDDAALVQCIGHVTPP